MKMSVEVFLVLFWVRGSATFCCVKFWGLVSVKPMGRWIRCTNEKRLAFFVTPAHFHRIFRVMSPVLFLYVTATGKLPVAFLP